MAMRYYPEGKSVVRVDPVVGRVETYYVVRVSDNPWCHRYVNAGVFPTAVQADAVASWEVCNSIGHLPWVTVWRVELWLETGHRWETRVSRMARTDI